MHGLEAVDPARVPATVPNPKFVAASIPATFEALLALRPHGYLPHWRAGKVWMEREFEPLSEEEAQKRIHAHEQKREEENVHLAELLEQTRTGISPTSSRLIGDTNLFADASEHTNQDRPAARCAPKTNGLVPL